jgi:ribosomal protein S18 acetylase RimI-like enzyme
MEIRPLAERELVAASRLTMPGLPDGDRAAIEVIDRAERDLGIDPRRQIVAVESGEVIGACLYVLSAGRAATVLRPVASPAFRREHRDALFRGLIAAAREACRRAGAVMIQAILEEAPDNPMARCFISSGFEFLALLEYMELPVKRARVAPLDTSWHFEPFLPSLQQRFSEAITSTYENSLDCPALDGLRAPEDVMAGHKASGLFTPEGWFLAARQNRDGGVLLVNRLARRSACEIVYMGVAPQYRGQGLGAHLVSKAIDTARQLQCRTLTVAVDAGNEPARRLYRAAGFEITGRRYTYFVPRAVRRD